MDIGIVGIGRMGWVHAAHLLELQQEGACRLTAVVDKDSSRVARFVHETGFSGQTFPSLEAYLEADLCKTSMVVTPTEFHGPHVMALVRAGHRVLLEKPLTGTLAGDIACCEELDRDYPNALMLAFQRRYDAALSYGRDLMRQGAIGRVFKIYSALEDSGPPPRATRATVFYRTCRSTMWTRSCGFRAACRTERWSSVPCCTTNTSPRARKILTTPCSTCGSARVRSALPNSLPASASRLSAPSARTGTGTRRRRSAPC